LDCLLHPGSRLEELECDKNQKILACVIQIPLMHADPAETLGPRGCKRRHNPPPVEIAAFLAPVDSRLRVIVVRALDRPALQLLNKNVMVRSYGAMH
jgi:hypothetical protein